MGTNDLVKSHGTALNKGSSDTESEATRKLWWSLGARSTASTPNAPLAPGLLSTTTTVLPDMVKTLVSGPSPWRLQIVEGSADHLLQLLLSGEIDLLLGRLPRQAGASPSRRGLEPPLPVVESPSFFYSLSVVAHTTMLTCCAQAAALHSGHLTSILPVTVSRDATPVAMIWRKSSAEAQRAADQLA